MQRFSSPRILIHNNIATTTTSNKIDVSSYDDIYIECAGSNTPDYKVKVKAGALEGVDFQAAASPSNYWTYIALADRADNSAISGSAGGVISGAATVLKTLRINDSKVEAIAIECEKVSGTGNLSVWVQGAVRS